MPLLVYLSLCLIWGFSWIGIKLTLEGADPCWGAGLRFLLALPLLGVFVVWKRQSLRFGPLWGMIALTALLSYGIDYGLIFWAESHLNAGITAVLFATFPLFTALFSRGLLTGSRLEGNIVAGLVLGFLGVALAFLEELDPEAFSRSLLATLAVVAAAASGALATVLVKRDLLHIHPVPLNFCQLTIGSGFLLVLSLAFGETWRFPVEPRPLFGLLYLALIASALAFTLYYWLLKRSSAVSVSTMVFVNPIVALVADWAVFGSAITWLAWGGVSLVLTGILVCEWPRYRTGLRRRLVN